MTRFSTAWPTHNILFHGDSITVGGNGGTYSTAAGGYRESVVKQIRVHRPNIKVCGWDQQGTFGTNSMCGTSGLRIDEMAADRYALSQSTAYQLDAIFMHAGTNDATQRNSGTWVHTLQDSLDNLTVDLGYWRSGNPSVHIFLAQIIPNQTAGADTLITEFNAALPAFVAARTDSTRTHLVDHNTAFRADPSWAVNLMADVTHPNAAGNVVMATTWYNSYVSIFP